MLDPTFLSFKMILIVQAEPNLHAHCFMDQDSLKHLYLERTADTPPFPSKGPAAKKALEAITSILTIPHLKQYVENTLDPELTVGCLERTHTQKIV